MLRNGRIIAFTLLLDSGTQLRNFLFQPGNSQCWTGSGELAAANGCRRYGCRDLARGYRVRCSFHCHAENSIFRLPPCFSGAFHRFLSARFLRLPGDSNYGATHIARKGPYELLMQSTKGRCEDHDAEHRAKPT